MLTIVLIHSKLDTSSAATEPLKPYLFLATLAYDATMKLYTNNQFTNY